MQRVTISLDEALAAGFDALSTARGYASRSEALRDIMREAITAQRTADETGDCVANLSYVYNHHERGMASRLMELQHAHHDLVLATSHIHLDHDYCLETVMLKGPVKAVRDLANAVQSERGVQHGALNLIGVRAGQHHAHGPNGEHHHLTPETASVRKV